MSRGGLWSLVTVRALIWRAVGQRPELRMVEGREVGGHRPRPLGAPRDVDEEGLGAWADITCDASMRPGPHYAYPSKSSLGRRHV